MQAEGFGFRAPHVWLVFSKCCFLTLPFPETQGKTRLSLSRGSGTALLGCTSDTHSFRIFIYLFLGVTLGGTSAERAVLPPCSHSARLPRALLLPALVTGHMASASSSLEHTLETTIQHFCLPRARPLLSSPLLCLVCLLSIIRLLALGFLLAPHPLHPLQMRHNGSSPALLQTQGTNSRWDLPQTSTDKLPLPCAFAESHHLPTLAIE